jgi:5-methylcytosine-specific restriction endonuclease McrA
MKICTCCLKEKSLFEFSPDKRAVSGVQSRCKPCYAEIMKIRRLANPEKHRLSVKLNTQKNYQKKLKRNNSYRLENPDKVSKWKAKDRQVNKARVLADNASRRALQRVPLTPEIIQIYALRDFYQSMSLGEKFHVDHIVPLSKGGCHTHTNLQVIPAIDNLRKGALCN